MPTLTRPGVYIDESSLPTYVSSTPGTAAACFVGPVYRGPLTPTVVNSWKQFTQYYGPFDMTYLPSPMHLAVYSYFSAGGTMAVIIRAHRLDASGPTTAETVFDDQNTGGAQPSLQVNAADPGAWGDNLAISVLPALPDPATSAPQGFTLQVYYKGTSPVNVVEQWLNVSMSHGSTNQGANNYAPDIINNPYTGSKYITVKDLSVLNPTPTPPPANNPQPTPVNAPVPLTGGGDGQPITFQDQFTALELLDQYPDQPFVINMPGMTDPSTVSQVVAYAEQRGDGFVVIDPPPGYSPLAMVQYAQAMSASAQCAIYYPQVQIADPYSSTPGVTRLVPPGGFVVGQYINTDAIRGVAKAPAGLGCSLLGVYGLETTLSNADQGNLTQANVNCLISVPGSGVVIWGARTLSPYLITRYVSVERSLIYLATEFIGMTKFAVFEPNDWVLWNMITSVLSQFLDAFWQSGGLSGQSAAQAYYVTCDDTVNIPATIQQGIVNIEVGVALQFPAEFVVISIGQWAGGSTVTTTTP